MTKRTNKMASCINIHTVYTYTCISVTLIDIHNLTQLNYIFKSTEYEIMHTFICHQKNQNFAGVGFQCTC